MSDEIKKDHLEGKHKGKEESFFDSCILCENYINAKRSNNHSGKDLSIFIDEEIDLMDFFVTAKKG